ncbi:hypothetical protein BHE74_00018261, partial [Ensete ventricosum]
KPSPLRTGSSRVRIRPVWCRWPGWISKSSSSPAVPPASSTPSSPRSILSLSVSRSPSRALNLGFLLRSQEIPKALLPVANRPVLSYVLELLEASNLKDLIVVSSFSPPILLSENLTVRCLGWLREKMLHSALVDGYRVLTLTVFMLRLVSI